MGSSYVALSMMNHTYLKMAKILSVNCQGLGSQGKRIDVFNFLKEKNCNVYCLQDTHFTKQSEKFIRAQWGHDCLFSFGTSNSRGVAILFSRNTDYKIHRHTSCPNGNYIIADLTIENHKLTLINIYGPNEDVPNYFQNIIDQAQFFQNDKIIWCGDFNVIQNPELDCYNYVSMNNKKSHEKISLIKDTFNLVDPYREHQPTSKRYTWRRKNPLKQARLDYFLITDNLLPSVENVSIEPSYRSDHSMVLLELKFSQFIKGKGLWKHNNSLLEDLEYLNTINEKITDIKKQYALPVYNLDNINAIPNDEIQFVINDQLFLDTLLMEIRGKSISYASFKKKEKENREATLINEIKTLEDDLTSNNFEQLEQLKDELINLRKYKMQGHFIRSRANIIEHDEKPSKYFCNLENYHYTSKIIPKIEMNDGTVITDQNEILRETRHFYETLYSSRDDNLIEIDLETEFRNVNMPKLSKSDSDSLEGLLSIEEASFALKHMKNNKSPGSDGFSADFFKAFWGKLGHFIVRSVNYGYEHGELSTTQREGVIVCIPKENKPRCKLTNYRPISLLNCVYKIASSSIANRIKSILTKLVNEDQTGFISGRYLGENTRLIYDIMHYAEENDMQALILLVDFEKAFDSLSWKFIHNVLDFFQFGNSVKKWIHMFYKNAKLCINLGGNLSTFFNIGRGCRQGDPISPYIFILCAEILAIKIRNNNKIKGIKIQNTEFKFSQYADDCSAILDGSPESLNETLNELTYFATYSGLNINFDKTQVVWIGIKKYSSDTINTRWKLKWGCTNFKLLGITFHVDLEKMIELNYKPKIVKIKGLINSWKRRYLSPIGKITVIKSLLLPAFNHLFISLPTPKESIIKEINTIFYDFLWEGPAKIKQSVLIKDYCDGGLKMVNLSAFIASLKITWIRRLLTSPGKWSSIQTKDINLKNITSFGDSYIDNSIKNVSNLFWKDVLNSYQWLLRKNEPTSVVEFLSTPIFNNNFFKVGDKPVFYKGWCGNGILTVNDLINDNGDFFSEQDLKKLFNIKSNFLNYQSIISTIKTQMKIKKIDKIEAKLQQPLRPFTVLVITKHSRGTGDIYAVLNKNNSRPTSESKWESHYQIDKKTWKNIHMSPFNSSHSTLLQWFQIRINHNILPTKKYLYHIKARDNPYCNSCELDETILHMLWYCPKTQEFLRQLKAFLQSKHITYNTEEKKFIFNLEKQPCDLAFSLIMKHYIFKAKYHNKTLSVHAAINKLKQYYKAIKCRAQNKNNSDLFLEEWNKYKEIVDPN